MDGLVLAGRYALTLRLILAIVQHKLGLACACIAATRRYAAGAHGRPDDLRQWHGGSKPIRFRRAGCDTEGFWVFLAC